MDQEIVEQEILHTEENQIQASDSDKLAKNAKTARLLAIIAACLGVACLIVPFLYNTLFSVALVISGILCFVAIGFVLLPIVLILGLMLSIPVEIFVFICLIASVVLAITALVMAGKVKKEDTDGALKKVLSVTRIFAIVGLIAAGLYTFFVYVLPAIATVVLTVLYVLYVIVMIFFAGGAAILG